jgi:hypothetical protein
VTGEVDQGQPGPVSIRTRFERFPATVKGAFVVRGEDTEPHQVRFLEGRVVRVPSGRGSAIELDPVVLEVPPHQDVFVPFEFPIGDLGPGWYAIESHVELDGSPRVFPGDRRFVMPWPRSSVRRGTLAAGVALAPGGGPAVELLKVDAEATALSVQFRTTPPRPVQLRVLVDGSRHEVVETTFDGVTGKGRLTAYPVPSSGRRMRVEVSGSPPAGHDLELG